MGSPQAKAYLASPEVVAASALNGTISGQAGTSSLRDGAASSEAKVMVLEKKIA